MRKEVGISQSVFASRIGYSVVQVRFVEYRKIVPSNDFLLAVAVAFGISYGWLLTGEGEEKSDEAVVDDALISWLRKNTDEVRRLRIKSGLV